MLKSNRKSLAKFSLENFHCGMCETGVVQVHTQSKRGGMLTTTVSGCLDCKHEYGLAQAGKLKPCSDDFAIYWA